jgi:hypothetical protein
MGEMEYRSEEHVRIRPLIRGIDLVAEILAGGIEKIYVSVDEAIERTANGAQEMVKNSEDVIDSCVVYMDKHPAKTSLMSFWLGFGFGFLLLRHKKTSV